MKNKVLFFILMLLSMAAKAEPVVADGVYSIACQQANGFVGLGAYHNMSPYISYVTNEQLLSQDAYWQITLTNEGYTFQNEASGQWLVFTYERVDAYYKYLTLVSELPEDGSQYWNILPQDDGSLCVQSVFDPSYYWNLRLGQGLLGTYAGSFRDVNERFYLTPKKTDDKPEPEPDPQPTTEFSFPEALHVYLKDGRIEAFPLTIITSHTEDAGQLVIQTSLGKTFSYPLTDVTSVSEQAPADFPMFESFKFNNKFNDQLFSDVLGDIDGDVVNLTVAAIGKRLTPSFKVPDDQTLVYVDGELQESKVTRLRFDKDIFYVVTRPGITMLLPDTEENASYSMHPYGRVVRVHVNWLTDRAEVPCIYINTADGSSDISRDEFKDATITIDGRDIFPSMEATAVQIKGRGNSSWGWPKKPYRLKFAEKVKPLDMKKGKNWVLLSNYQTGSLMTNAIGMKAANLMEASAANHIVPVDLYLNGEYLGSYNFTEKVGLSNNSVELDDESAAALLELDSYFDEPEGQKFYSWPYGLPINVKEPDFSESTSLITLETVENDFNQFLQTVYNGGDLSRHVDLLQLVRFLMVNELICNFELYHPKSTFCYRENFQSDTSKYVFGPVWDLDWAFGYEGHYRYFQDNATTNYWTEMPFNEVRDFMRDLRFKYAPLNTLYFEQWEKFMQDDLTELMEFCQDYYDFAHVSFENNRDRWGDYTDYQEQARTAANWLKKRATLIYNDLLKENKEIVNVTYDYVFDGQVIHSETVQVPEGSVPVSPLADNWFLSPEPMSTLPETIESDSHFTYKIIWNGPFQFTHSQAEAHWYNMTIRSFYHVSVNDSEPYYPKEVDEETLQRPEYQWAFGGDPLHIKVYNRATGMDQVLTLDGLAGDNQVNTVMRMGDYSWEIRPNSDGFVLSPHNHPDVCINQYGGPGGALQTWKSNDSPTDDGSTFRIVKTYDVVVPEITPDDKTREYGEDNPVFTYTVTSELKGKPELTTTATKTSPVGVYDIIVERGTVEGDYTAQNGKLTVTKAPLTITAKSYTIQQGDALPTFIVTYAGFKNKDTPAVLKKKSRISCDATSLSEPGTYEIKVEGAEAENYEISYVSGTLTITAPQTYKLIYMVDGKEYQTTEMVYGTEVNPIGEPSKEGYTFSGWIDLPEYMPAHDVTVTGIFTVNHYKVTFMYGDNVLTTIDVNYGDKIELPTSLNSERYTLIEWLDVPETMPAHDITIYADYVDGIEVVRSMTEDVDDVYNLAGQRLARPTKGLNIVGGKKVWVK